MSHYKATKAAQATPVASPQTAGPLTTDEYTNGRIILLNPSIPSFSHKSSKTQIAWIIESGATYHVICCSSYYKAHKRNIACQVQLPDKRKIHVTPIGDVKLSDHITLHNVLCS